MAWNTERELILNESYKRNKRDIETRLIPIEGKMKDINNQLSQFINLTLANKQETPILLQNQTHEPPKLTARQDSIHKRSNSLALGPVNTPIIKAQKMLPALKSIQKRNASTLRVARTTHDTLASIRLENKFGYH